MSKAKKQREDITYRVYITDAIRAITENTARAVKDGVYMSQRYVDIAYPAKDVKEDDQRTCREIVNDMWKKIRGEAETNESV